MPLGRFKKKMPLDLRQHKYMLFQFLGEQSGYQEIAFILEVLGKNLFSPPLSF